MTAVTTFRGMERGHPVKVKGLRGDYTFRSADVDSGGRVVAVFVCSARGSKRMGIRVVTPDRVVKRRVVVS